MPTLLDNELETHEGAEPRVMLSDIQRLLQQRVRPGSEYEGVSVAEIAERADVSTRTVYRVLNPDDESKDTISFDLADNICLACGVHMSQVVRLKWPTGKVTDYLGAELVG